MELAPVQESVEFDWPALVMTVAEVAAVVRVTPKTVRQHTRRGLLRALQLDGSGPYRVRAQDTQRWAQQQLLPPDGGALAVDRYVGSPRRAALGWTRPEGARAAHLRRPCRGPPSPTSSIAARRCWPRARPRGEG